ncbi:MAG: CoA-binding protein [Candidatus Thalassarchaeaceae archaeon]|jgi:hypothetical protein|nr:CoA-binding protein [Candidatus Thalassarchaeaceae archaeon]MDP7043755.1 CoA-binding protein [Candidatus Thalassarchaeaceae archaeon]
MHSFRKFDNDEAIQQSLGFTNIAIISHDFNQNSPALGDMKGLISRGFEVYPINPDLAENNITLDGKKVSKTVSDVEDEVQIVVMHVEPEWIFDVISDLSWRTEHCADIRTLWIEPGINISDKVRSDAHDFGWMVVEDCCILSKVMEHNISHI